MKFCWGCDEIRASNPRKQKTDKRDARHILSLLCKIVFRRSGCLRWRTMRCGSCCCIVAAWYGCARGSRTSWMGWPRTKLAEPAGVVTTAAEQIEGLP